MRLALVLTVLAMSPAAMVNAQEPGNWQFIETADTVYAWGDMVANGMEVNGHRFILSKTPQTSFMGDVSIMSHDFTLDCGTMIFTQRSGQYLALDGTVMGPSAPRPSAEITPASGEEMIKAAVCEGRPIDGAVVAATREIALTEARAKASAAP
jgi:hypothetical protein